MPPTCLPARLAIASACALLLANAPAQERRRNSDASADAAALAKLLAQYDADKDGKVQRTEYPRGDQPFANLDRNRDGVVDAADFAAPTPPARARAAAPRRAQQAAKLPQVGDLAPDFDLPMLGMKGATVKLSSLRGDRPVALVFGSYT